MVVHARGYRLFMINESQIVPYETQELPVDVGPWLVFAPHPDDETFGMGATLAKAVNKGIDVNVVIMTDGALGGSHSDLVKIRQEETRRALEILGASGPVFLDNRDRALDMNEFTIKQAKEQIDRVRPKAVFFPGVYELHPDHRAAAQIVWKALQTDNNEQIVPVSYEVLVQSPVNLLVDVSNTMYKKKAAIACYASQLAENRYLDISMAMARLRTLTLGSEVNYAEGFYRFGPNDLTSDLESCFKGKLSRFFEG